MTISTSSPASIAASVVVERHSDRLPRFVVIPSPLVGAWRLQATTTVEGTVNGFELGRRSLKPWGAERWFIEFPNQLCKKARIDVGSTANLTLRLASGDLPAELASLLRTDPRASAAWSALTDSRQRMLREHVLSAKSAEGRRQRAQSALSPCTETSSQR